MMVAHLNVPALDNTGAPTTLSNPVVTGLLRQQLGFKGVVFTDAMNMKGVITKVPTGEAEHLDTLRVATLVLGGSPADTTDFQRAVADYDARIAHFHLPTAPTMDELTDIRAKLFSYDVVLVALQSLGRLPATNFGIAPEAQLILRELTKPGQRVILSVFGSAYAVAKPGLRLAYAHPEDAGMDRRLEARIDSVMAQALATGATPGGQVVIARRGVVVLRKSYG
nr:hypothetical protein [Tanacetum cinerariifolium]